MLIQKSNWSEIIKWYDDFNKNKIEKPKTHWILDIDETLLDCEDFIGSTKWFDDSFKRTRNKALVVKKWVELVPYLKYRLIDSNIENFFNKLKDENAEFTAVTARHCAAQNYTVNHLKENNLEMIQDIISCGYIPKSRMVLYFIQPHLNSRKKYIFIDDKKSNVIDMHQRFPNIICIWLNRDKRSKMFDIYSFWKNSHVFSSK
tara:strand:- start:5735 stop:6343 length:609 start_codon:yes stop_codon:yes gene_type:complete